MGIRCEMVKVVNDGVVMFHRVGEARVETYCGMFETYKRGILKWTKLQSETQHFSCGVEDQRETNRLRE